MNNLLSSDMAKNLISEWSRKTPLFLEKDDERYERHVKQLKEHGFSDAETWALDSVIAKFILPRLRRFKEVNNGFPCGLTSEKWNAILDQMIFAFDWSINCEEDKYKDLTTKEQNINWLKYEVGIQQFAKYFRDLWW